MNKIVPVAIFLSSAIAFNAQAEQRSPEEEQKHAQYDEIIEKIWECADAVREVFRSPALSSSLYDMANNIMVTSFKSKGLQYNDYVPPLDDIFSCMSDPLIRTAQCVLDKRIEEGSMDFDSDAKKCAHQNGVADLRAVVKDVADCIVAKAGDKKKDDTPFSGYYYLYRPKNPKEMDTSTYLERPLDEKIRSEKERVDDCKTELEKANKRRPMLEALAYFFQNVVADWFKRK